MSNPHPTPDAVTGDRPTPMARAARAAYTRPEGTIPFERRSPRRRAYWHEVAERAVKAALRADELEAVIAHHTWDYDHDTEHYRCSCGEFYVGDPVTDHTRHLAQFIRLTILAPHLLTPIPTRTDDEETNR